MKTSKTPQGSAHQALAHAHFWCLRQQNKIVSQGPAHSTFAQAYFHVYSNNMRKQWDRRAPNQTDRAILWCKTQHGANIRFERGESLCVGYEDKRTVRSVAVAVLPLQYRYTEVSMYWDSQGSTNWWSCAFIKTTARFANRKQWQKSTTLFHQTNAQASGSHTNNANERNLYLLKLWTSVKHATVNTPRNCANHNSSTVPQYRNRHTYLMTTYTQVSKHQHYSGEMHTNDLNDNIITCKTE